MFTLVGLYAANARARLAACSCHDAVLLGSEPMAMLKTFLAACKAVVYHATLDAVNII